jgi:adenylate cyclase
MQSRLENINGSIEDDLSEPMRLGLGIHMSSVIVGEIGHVKASRITEFGVGVYSSSPLEKLTKEIDAEIIVSQFLLNYAGEQLPDGEAHDTFLKGRRFHLSVIAQWGLLLKILDMNPHGGA